MTEYPKASIITIGDEILIGQIVDTNSAWLGAEFSKLGIAVVRVFSIPDEKESILSTLQDALKISNVIILTGGLGPTSDDITKFTLAQFFNSKLVLHDATLKHVESIFARRGFSLLESNRLQAMVPDNCKVLPNPTGTAPGMWFENEGKIVVSLPGVPFEMKAIMENSVFPALQSTLTLPSIEHVTLLTAGIGESILAEKIKSVELALPSHIKLAYLPSLAEVRLRLSGNGKDKILLSNEIRRFAEEIRLHAGAYIYGEDIDTLESVIGQLCISKKATLSTAESCTGGYLAHKITSVPGSSAYYMGSILSYSNAVKHQQLHIPIELINHYGAVSEPVAKAMAENVKNILKTDFAIATTGVAGPGGGSEEKPVGTVWIGVSGPTGTFARMFSFGDDRQRTIHRTAIMGMDMLRRMLIQDESHT